MSVNELVEGISFNNMNINSIVSSSGVFAGHNIQYLWKSRSSSQFGFGTVTGEENLLENPCNVVTDPESSSELLVYFKGLVLKKFGE